MTTMQRLVEGERVFVNCDDCIDDLVAAGLLESIGTAVNPRYSLTTAGFKVAAALRAHKAAGGVLKDFNPRGAV